MNGLLPGNLKNALKKFRTDKEYSELIRTSFFALLVRMTGILTGFIVTLTTTRYFGAEALGIVSICLAILSFSSVFGKLGLDVALMKYVAEFSLSNNYPAIKAVYLEAIKSIIPVTILISTLLYFLAPWMADTLFHKPHLTELLHYNALLALPLVLLLVNSECIRGLKRISSYTFLQTVSVSLFAAILLLAFIFINQGKEIPVFIQFISIMLSAILSLVLWIKFSKYNSCKPSKEVSSNTLIRTSSSMFITTMMQLIMSWAGTLILASNMNETDVGVYNALIRISVATNITILAINSLVLPRFAEAFASKSFDTMKKLAGESTRLIFLTSLPIFILLAVFPHWILSVFGKEFPGNETALYILLAGQLIVCFSGLSSQILNMSGHQHVLRNIAIVSAIVNVLACFILIPIWGIAGACYAQGAGIICWNLLSNISVKRYFGFFVFFKFK